MESAGCRSCSSVLDSAQSQWSFFFYHVDLEHTHDITYKTHQVWSMRLGGYVTVMLLLATLSDCHNDTHAHIGIDCCSLMDSMQRFIALETNPVMHCHPETCMASSLVKLFVQETDTQMELQRQPTRIELTIPAEDNRFTEMLVWALIGRHYAANLAGDHTHFIFNTATQTLTAKMPKCEFQKPIYTILLFVSIISLIFS